MDRTQEGLDHALARLGADSEGPRADFERQAMAARLFGEEPSARIGRFAVLRSIGRGGMGEVFAARDEELDRTVAIKLMRRTSDAAAERFLREGRALARLSHANIVHVHEVGVHEGSMYIAMEYIAGRTLGALLRDDERRTWQEILRLYLEAGRGLAAAHAVGLVHRDFKPDNVMVGDDGRVRVLDFGLARSIGAIDRAEVPTTHESHIADESGSERRVTETGMLLGTPAYMAPEQHRALAATPASDQFSFCVALFEALYGVRPFPGTSRSEVLRAIDAGAIVSVAGRAPRRIRRAILRGLRARPADRWSSMDALDAALRRQLGGRRIWVLAPLAAAGLALGYTGWQRAELVQRCEGADVEIAEAWNQSTREQIAEVVRSSELPYALESWTRIERGFDDWAEAWALAHRDACEATRVRETQSSEAMDLRMSCLRGRRTEFAALVDTVATADATSLADAFEGASKLPSLERCSDLDALRADLPPPEDLEVAAEVERLRDRLAHARALFDAGRAGAAEPEGEELVFAAERLGYEPFRAEALLFRGVRRERAGDYEEAKLAFEESFTLAALHGHDSLEAEASQWLARVIGEGLLEVDAGIAWGNAAVAIATRPGRSKEERARALTSLAVVQHTRGDLFRDIDGAVANFERAMTLREEEHGVNDLRVGETARAFARLHHWLSRRPEMLDFVRTPEIGSRQPAMELDISRTHKAAKFARRAVAITEVALGPEHPRLVGELALLVNILEDLGEHDEAWAMQERASEIAERTLAADHPDRAEAMMSRGRLLQRSDRAQEALPWFEKALATLEARLEPDSALLARPLVRICMVNFELGRLDAARPACERASELRIATFGETHVSVATPALMLGMIFRRQASYDAAEIQLERSFEAVLLTHGGGHHSADLVMRELAELALDVGDATLAIEYADRAVDIGTINHAVGLTPAHARFIRARAMYERDDLRPFARESALTAQRELIADTRYPKELAEIETWLESH